MRHALLFPAQLAGSCLTLAFLSGSIRADVLVVHATNGPFTTIQAAVDAALDGDTVLVKPGSYNAFSVTAKALTIAGDAGGPILVGGSCAVRNLAPGSRVVVSGLTITVPETWSLPPEYPKDALRLVNNAGDVRVEACGLAGQSFVSWVGVGGSGAWVHGNAGSVAFVACTMTGGIGASSHSWDMPATDGNAGLDIQDTRVAVYDCTLTGGRGGDGYDGCGTGGHGAWVRASTQTSGLFASGSSFQGGRGGDDWEDTLNFLSDPGDGGNGLELDAGTSAQMLDNAYAGGEPGIGLFCPGPEPGLHGVGIGGPGHVHTYNVTRVKLVAPAVARESTMVSLAVHGQPGEEVFLFSSRETGFAIMPSWRGTLIPTLRSPALAMILGTIPVSGVLDVSYPLPALPSGVAARDLYLQSWRRDSTGAVTLGSFAVLTVLDTAY